MKTNTVAKAEATVKQLEHALLRIEAYMEETRKDQANATQELRAKLQAVEQPFNATLASYEDKHYKTRQALGIARRTFEVAQAQAQVQRAKRLKFFVDDTFDAFLEANQIRKSGVKCAIKEFLPNGLTVFQVKTNWDSNNSYFVMYKTRLVGYWFRQQARHRGERYDSWAWSNVNRLTFKNVKKNQLAKDFIASFAKVRKPQKLPVIGIAKNLKVLQAENDYDVLKAVPQYTGEKYW